MSLLKTSFSVGSALFLFIAISGCSKDSSESRPLTEKEISAIIPTEKTFVADEPESSSAEDLACFRDACADSPSLLDPAGDHPVGDFTEIQKLIDRKYALEKKRDEMLFAAAEKMDLRQIQFTIENGDLYFGVLSLGRLREVSRFLIQKSNRFMIDRSNYEAKNQRDPARLTSEMMDVIDAYLNLSWVRAKISGVELWDIFRSPESNDKEIAVRIAYLTARYFGVAGSIMHRLGLPTMPESAAEAKALAGQELTTAEGAAILDLYCMASFFELMSSSLKGISERAHFRESPFYQALLQVPLEKIEKRARDMSNERSGKCALNYQKAIAGSFPDSELSSINRKVEQTKIWAIEELNLVVQDPSQRGALAKRIAGLKFKFAANQSEMRTAIEVGLNDSVARMEKFASEQKISETSILGSILTQALGVFLEERLGASGSNEECSEFDVTRLSDFAMTSLGKISVSAPTLRFSAIGQAIIAHEIGHVVFRSLNNDSDVEPGDLVSLQRQNNEILSCEANRLKGNVSLLNESFSDSFSAHVMRRVKKESTNFACSFLKRKGSSLDLEVENGDSHPASFFRALSFRETQQPDSLSPLCRGVLKRGGFGSLKPCW